jgi:hypothetical protein
LKLHRRESRQSPSRGFEIDSPAYRALGPGPKVLCLYPPLLQSEGPVPADSWQLLRASSSTPDR